jgi:hypothetical protein
MDARQVTVLWDTFDTTTTPTRDYANVTTGSSTVTINGTSEKLILTGNGGYAEASTFGNEAFEREQICIAKINYTIDNGGTLGPGYRFHCGLGKDFNNFFGLYIKGASPSLVVGIAVVGGVTKQMTDFPTPLGLDGSNHDLLIRTDRETKNVDIVLDGSESNKLTLLAPNLPVGGLGIFARFNEVGVS